MKNNLIVLLIKVVVVRKPLGTDNMVVELWCWPDTKMKTLVLVRIGERWLQGSLYTGKERIDKGSLCGKESWRSKEI